jgi:hypothetical protein
VAGVPELLLDVGARHAVLEQEAGVGVPQAVRRVVVWQPSSLQDALWPTWYSMGVVRGETNMCEGRAQLGLLAQPPTTLEAFRGVAERLLVDAIEPIEQLARGA